MLQLHEPPSTLEAPPTGAAPTMSVAPSPDQPKRWPWILAGVVVIAIGMAAAAWWLLDSTVPTSDYDEVVAELDASKEAVAAAEAGATQLESELDAVRAENAQVTAELAAETEQVSEYEALNASMQARLDAALTTAKANAYLALDWLPEDIVAMEDVGIDSTIPDALLRELGENETWIEWVNSNRVWIMRDRYIFEIDDPVLTDAWTRYWDAEIGSAEELAAMAEFNIRMADLALTSLLGE